jgi:hypothetical protein
MIFEPFNPKNHIKIALKNTYFPTLRPKKYSLNTFKNPPKFALDEFFSFLGKFLYLGRKKSV